MLSFAAFQLYSNLHCVTGDGKMVKYWDIIISSPETVLLLGATLGITVLGSVVCTTRDTHGIHMWAHEVRGLRTVISPPRLVGLRELPRVILFLPWVSNVTLQRALHYLGEQGVRPMGGKRVFLWEIGHLSLISVLSL